MAVLEPESGSRSDFAAGPIWSKFLDANLDRFQRTVGVPVGERLGCGLFGCVFESSPPWVVKFTRDPTEGPIWAYMAELLSDPEVTAELDSFLRVRDVVRIRPDVLFQGEEMPVYGVVREEAIPVLRDHPDIMTEETLRRVGATERMLAEAGVSITAPSLNLVVDRIAMFPPPVRSAFRELVIVLLALREYKRYADVFHQWRARLMYQDYGGHTREEAEDISDSAFREMLWAIESMRGNQFPNRFGEEMGRTLLTSVNFGDLVFRDLHLMNIGWRIHKTIDGDERPLSMVILDPGAMATPYEPAVREVELVANLSRFARSRP